jgi:hypothetical protein
VPDGKGIGNINITTVPNHNEPSLLASNTVYYARAYALTENNISGYGNEITFTTLPTGQAGPAGGIVFYDKGVYSDGWRYLEAAPSDQSARAQWGCYNTLIGGTSVEIGTGAANTATIVARCTENGTATKICSDLTLGGQSDWFLPSVKELFMMYYNLKRVGLGNFADSYYWSSSEYNVDYAWVVYFSSGIPIYNSIKYDPNNVRSIRAF